MKLYAEAIYAKNSMTTRIAPYPTGYFPLPASSDLVSTYIVPHLTDAEKAAYDAGNLDVNARWRALPAGNRTTEYDTTAVHLVTGLEGNFGEFDYDFGLFYSSNDRDQDYPTGWLIRDKFVDVVSSGAVNVFVPGSELDAASAEALAPAIYHGNWNTTKVEVSGLDFKGSLPVFEMPAGEAYLGFGGDYRMTSYKRDISEANKNAELLFLSTGDVYDLERDSYGGFVELVVPVIEDLEITASGRYDAIGGVDDKINGFTVNDTLDDFTYKLSARYQVTDELLLRASYGTGFKAPSMLGIAQPRQESGVTSDSYACPFPSGDPLAQYCLSGRSQYSVFTQGYANLKPETSEQYSVGFVYAPDSNFSITIDYWNVEMEDQVSSLSEAQIFGNPALYRDLFTTKRNLATNEDELAIIQADVNIGKSKNSGIDWDVRNNYELGWGDLSTYFVGTYMMESEYTLPGTDDVFVSSMGKFGENNSVTFRVISQIGATLTTGDFQNTLIAKYRSGYQDQFQSKGGCAVVTYTNGVLGDCVDIQLRVPSYTTFNYQGRYFVNDNLSVMAGVNNLFDKAPALSLRGGGSGHQVGYDPRYTDSYGRTYYIQADYKF